MLTQFAACIAVLLLLATPLFYFLTKHYYAEDMIDIIEAVGQGQPIPALDLEEDIMHGIMIQFGVITVFLAVAIVLTVRANRTLLESLVNNLVVNAVRYNRPGGEIYLTVSDRELTVSNTSDEPALDARLIFNRFYRPSEKVKGNGLGLAIVRAICEYHGWTVGYQYRDGLHKFTVNF